MIKTTNMSQSQQFPCHIYFSFLRIWQTTSAVKFLSYLKIEQHYCSGAGVVSISAHVGLNMSASIHNPESTHESTLDKKNQNILSLGSIWD